jgi:translation initiation factor IF-1
MVRNTSGGSKTKSFARKSIQPTASIIDYSPKDELEKIAVVTKLYGNGMCQVITADSPQLDLMCHIRGKFRGRSKKHNMLSVNSRIVIGLRDWENPYKNADLISVLSTYEDSAALNGGSKEKYANDSFTFSNEDTHEMEELPPQKLPDNLNTVYEDDINIDDI